MKAQLTNRLVAVVYTVQSYCDPTVQYWVRFGTHALVLFFVTMCRYQGSSSRYHVNDDVLVLLLTSKIYGTAKCLQSGSTSKLPKESKAQRSADSVLLEYQESVRNGFIQDE